MANTLKTLNVNSVDFSFKDTEARNEIETINEEKAEKFSVYSPLKFENNILTIDLSKYATTKSFNETTEGLNNKINSNNNTLSKKILDIQEALKTIFKDGIIIENNDIIINQNKIPSLSDYESRIEKINSSINIINTNIGEIAPPLQEEINDKYNDVIEKINAIDNTESITNLQVRISKIENNLFGSNETIEHNRIDDLEAKVNDIYNRLTSIGILPKEE